MYKECIKCNKQVSKLHARGICHNCYTKWYKETHFVYQQWLKQWKIDNNAKMKEYQKAHYLINKEMHQERCKKRRSKVRDINLKYLATIKPIACEKCGYNKCFAAIELHHLDSRQKDGLSDRLSCWLQYAPERFAMKILKTKFKLLCSNCHKEIHNGVITNDEQIKSVDGSRIVGKDADPRVEIEIKEIGEIPLQMDSAGIKDGAQAGHYPVNYQTIIKDTT